MARVVRARVDDRDLGSRFFRTDDDRCKVMRSIFKRMVDDYGILTEYKIKSRHESESEKRRRKRKESAIKKRKEMYKPTYNKEEHSRGS